MQSINAQHYLVILYYSDCNTSNQAIVANTQVGVNVLLTIAPFVTYWAVG